MNPLLLLSGIRLAEMIRNQEVTSQEVVEVHIQHIEKVNPVINAVVHDRFDQAREEARNADQMVRSRASLEELPPFLGVPCTIKEAFALTGMPNTSGLWSRRRVVSTFDATSVSRLRASGAIPVGVTNVPELCMWYETYNRIYGRTRNPYKPNRIAGGSSGGEGAIIGAGGSPFGLGSDIGGSIRMPAFFNGIFGHKPSGGMVPGTGQYPFPQNQARRYLATGPLARRAEDLFPLLKILKGPDGKDTGCSENSELRDPHTIKISDLKVVSVPDNGVISVHSDLRTAQKNCAEALSKSGAIVEIARLEKLKKSFDIWSAMISASRTTSFRTLLADGKPFHPIRELFKLAFRSSHHTLPALVLSIIERVPELFPRRTVRLVELGIELRREIEALLGSCGVMLYPSFPRLAPRHNSPLFTPFHFSYTAIINVLELPSTQVPLGLNSEGLPLGVQVIGIHGNDHLTIRVAMELEKIFGGWVPPEFSE